MGEKAFVAWVFGRTHWIGVKSMTFVGCCIAFLLLGFGADIFSGSDDNDESNEHDPVWDDEGGYGGGDTGGGDTGGGDTGGGDTGGGDTGGGDTTDIYGTDGDDALYGSEIDDVIFGLGGNDLVNGGDGNDYVEGGEGDDELTGGEGGDQLLGMEGSDTIYGEGGTDTADGGPGNDFVYGDWGDDYVLGGEGDDVVKGGAGEDTVDGQEGDDQIHGGLGADTLLGGAGNDILEGVIIDTPMGPDTDEGDILYGAEGDDLLALGNGDEGTGGEGDDIFRFGTWITGDVPTVTDYVAADDQIVINYDELVSPAPVLSVSDITDGGNSYTVLNIDGQDVGRILINDGAPPVTAADIALVPSVW